MDIFTVIQTNESRDFDGPTDLMWNKVFLTLHEAKMEVEEEIWLFYCEWWESDQTIDAPPFVQWDSKWWGEGRYQGISSYLNVYGICKAKVKS